MAETPDEFDDLKRLRVWLVHDWLTGMRGGEKVLLELVRMFPQARIATLLMVPGAVDEELAARVEIVSGLQRVPAIGRIYRNLLPLMPRAVRGLKLPACDLVISSSHCVAKGVPVPAGARHLCYCHTPMRYIWGLEDHYVPRPSLRRWALRRATPALQRFDLASNPGVGRFVANSQHVAARIRRCYGRDAAVVYPGVDATRMVPDPRARADEYLVVSALVPYKRIDLAVTAFRLGTLRGRRLTIIGTGPEERRLRALARGADNITFRGWVDDAGTVAAYQNCRALVFPGEEDFGLTPVEAQACGRPVIAYGRGGAAETVVDHAMPGATGWLFDHQTAEDLAAAVEGFEAQPGAISPETCRRQALRFTADIFRAQMARAVRALLAGRA